MLLLLQLQMGMPDLVLFSTACLGRSRPSRHATTIPARAGGSGLGCGLGQERLLLVGPCCMLACRDMASGVAYMLHQHGMHQAARSAGACLRTEVF